MQSRKGFEREKRSNSGAESDCISGEVEIMKRRGTEGRKCRDCSVTREVGRLSCQVPM